MPELPSGTEVDPTDRKRLSTHLERFADGAGVEESDDGTVTVRFSRSTAVSVDPTGHVTTGMPLHAFEGPADRLVFDHEAGELHVVRAEGTDAITYTFRRP